MKNTARVPVQPSATGAASQTETPVQPADNTGAKVPDSLNLPPDAHPSCLAYYDRKDKVAVSHVPLSEEENIDVMVNAHKAGLSNGEFVANAIRERLSRERCGFWDALSELEQTVYQSNALMQLLSDQMEFQRINGSEPAPEDHSLFTAGVNLLMRQTTAKLRKDYQAVFDSNRGKPSAS